MENKVKIIMEVCDQYLVEEKYDYVDDGFTSIRVKDGTCFFKSDNRCWLSYDEFINEMIQYLEWIKSFSDYPEMEEEALVKLRKLRN